ncbi:MAG: ArsR/SmtB family transcription factor [Haloferacaceae archaeon]
MSDGWDPDNVMDVFGNEYARQILALGSVEPMPAEDMAEVLDASLPTVYRRVNVLLEYDLLKERTQVDDEGHHYKTFETSLRRVAFEVEDGGVNIDMELRRDLFDRFSDFWQELEDAGSPFDAEDDDD